MAKYSLLNQNGKSDGDEVLSITRQNPGDTRDTRVEIRDMNGKTQKDHEVYSITNQNGER